MLSSAVVIADSEKKVSELAEKAGELINCVSLLQLLNFPAITLMSSATPATLREYTN